MVQLIMLLTLLVSEKFIGNAGIDNACQFKKIVQSIIFKKGYSYQIYTILALLLRIIYYL